MNHPVLKEIKKSSRVTLCVVLESLVTKGEGDLSKDKDIIGKEFFRFPFISLWNTILLKNNLNLESSLIISTISIFYSFLRITKNFNKKVI